ncbi:hypothetical protein F4779DRAFT_619654 [Xylariaceae sp. FL0662B]|nr:hypothetical protein F4779DRAFT_619654 [Xylariaceae sp. FL0662B]
MFWPPQCCGQRVQPIDVAWIQDDELLDRFTEVDRELNTKNPVYCCNPRCSQLLDRSTKCSVSNTVKCPRCNTETCLCCKLVYHPNRDCEDDPEERELQRLAEAENWKRCTECGRMIQLNEGCYHMRFAFYAELAGNHVSVLNILLKNSISKKDALQKDKFWLMSADTPQTSKSTSILDLKQPSHSSRGYRLAQRLHFLS